MESAKFRNQAVPVDGPESSSKVTGKRRRSQRGLARVVLALCAVVLAITIADLGLGALGFPTDPAPIVTHPPNLAQRRQTLEFDCRFCTNSQGLRYPELPLAKGDSREFRWVVVGDSFTEGWGVEYEQSLCALLEQQLSGNQPIRYINCGVAHTGPRDYGRRLFHVGMKYHPDAVLIVLHANDLFDTPVDSVFSADNEANPRSGLKRRLFQLWPHLFVLTRKALGRELVPESATAAGRAGDFIATATAAARQKGITEAAIDRWKQRLPADLVRAVNLGRLNPPVLSYGLFHPDCYTLALDVVGPEAERRWRSMETSLSNLVDYCRGNHMAAAVVFTPTAFQHDPTIGRVWKAVGLETRDSWYTSTTEVQRRLERWAAATGTPYLDLTPAFQKASKERPGVYNYPLDLHWTPEGHAFAVSIIGPWLRSLHSGL